MPMMRPETSTLLLIDFQAKLMPAIDQAAATITNARRLVDAAGLVGAPILFTEQNPKGLGPTVAELAPERRRRPVAAPGHWRQHVHKESVRNTGSVCAVAFS